MRDRIFTGDVAQEGLIEHLAQTERIFRRELRKIDVAADCEVLPAADLSIPYDGIRLSGGFATGCFVQWECSVPVVPIDITMNIDTSSVFWVEESAGDMFTDERINCLRRTIESFTAYQWNLDESNHFAIFARERFSGRFAIIVHSNEREFKNQYNGLCPTKGNWYEREIVVSDDGRLRLLVGRSAEIFSKTAHMLEPFNVVRHRFIVHELLAGHCPVTEERHVHHYYMPTAQSAALGCYVVPSGEAVPIFSRPGSPILLFAGDDGGPNKVRVSGEERYIIPHGFGVGLNRPLRLDIRSKEFEFQGRIYPRQPRVTLLEHPDVNKRDFSSPEAFLNALKTACPGHVLAIFDQIRSLTRDGFRLHAG